MTTPSLADIARGQGYQIDQGWSNNGVPAGGTRNGVYHTFTGGKTPDTLEAEGQVQKQKQAQQLADAKKNGILDPKFDANGKPVGGVSAVTGQTLIPNADGNLRPTGKPDMDALKAAQQRHTAAEAATATSAPAQTHTDEEQSWNSEFGHYPGTASHPTSYPTLTPPAAPQIIAGSPVDSADALRDAARIQPAAATPTYPSIAARNAGGYITDAGAQASAGTAYDRAHPGETAARSYGKIGQVNSYSDPNDPGSEASRTTNPDGSTTIHTLGGGTVILPKVQSPSAAATPTAASTNPALAANPTLPDSVKGESTTKFPSVSPSGTFRPGTFNGAPKTVGLDTGVNVPAVSDPGTSGVPGFKAPSLGSTPFPTLSTPSSFAGPTTADGQTIVAGQPAPAPVPQPSPAPTTAAESGLAARKAVGDAFNSASGALDRASAATGNAVKNTIDATTSFVTGSPKSATDGLSAYAPNTGEPTDTYAATSPQPSTPNDKATQRLLDGDARGGMGTATPAGGFNQATKDMQVDSTVALNGTGQQGTLPASRPPTLSTPEQLAGQVRGALGSLSMGLGYPSLSSSVGATAATTPNSFGASTTYVPPPTDEQVSRAMNGGTSPAASTSSPKPTPPPGVENRPPSVAAALSSAPGYGADAGTYSATPATASSARSPDGSNASPDGSARSPDGTNASPDSRTTPPIGTSTAATALTNAPGFSPSDDVTSKPPGDDASTMGNAVYQPKDQPTGNAVYNPDAAASGNALYHPPTLAAPNPDNDEEQKEKAAAAAFIGI